jgi:hypothetical protein
MEDKVKKMEKMEEDFKKMEGNLNKNGRQLKEKEIKRKMT